MKNQELKKVTGSEETAKVAESHENKVRYNIMPKKNWLKFADFFRGQKFGETMYFTGNLEQLQEHIIYLNEDKDNGHIYQVIN